MKKHYATAALAYGILGLCCGVFYREYTKLLGFAGDTALSVAHTHYLMLGTLFFLLLLALNREAPLSAGGHPGKLLGLYHAGLNLMVVMLLTRGVFQVTGAAVSPAVDASISGLAGVAHILLGVSLVRILLRIRKVVSAPAQTAA